MYVRLTPNENTKHLEQHICSANYKAQAAASPTMDEAAAWFVEHSLFLFPVLFRHQIGDFFEGSVKILLVVVSNQTRNRRSPPIGRLQQRFGGIDPQAIQVVYVFHSGLFFEQDRQVETVDEENIRQEIQRDGVGITIPMGLF